MKKKTKRLEALKVLISSTEFSSQEEMLQALRKEGFTLTQATLSRDLTLLKVAKAANMNGKYVYVLPNETMYKRIHKPISPLEMLQTPGFISINFSGNIGSIAYNIDASNLPKILGTIAGDDTIVIVIKEGVSHEEVTESLGQLMPGY